MSDDVRAPAATARHPGRGPRNESVLKIAFPGVLFVFSVAIVVQAVQLTGPLAESNAQLYPIVVASLLALGSVVSIIGAVRGTGEPLPHTVAAAGTDEPDEAAEQDRGGRTRALVVLIASVAYPLAMPVLGFHLTTVVYASALSYLLQERSWRGRAVAAATGVGITLFCHLTFVLVLQARLPTGVIF
ncbi:tripartite tricarboxylate transporter TctB family protein [Ruania zhangjianzhongii]|uniref:tripartite tricarboxylate transporter TctB family protein n=1 Tax=Ruania zhangjianzhongii TaxID=2603206 RepID=UPI0011CC50CF|nr:tripartite tricarboxylate transporter TctB family protein [Ruania zhangjianzhongii]